MAEPLSKAPPPPPTPEQLAQGRKQKRLVFGTLLGILLAVAGWQGYRYFTSAPQRAEAKIQAGIEKLSPGGYAEAIQLFDDALSALPGSWSAYYHRGLAKQNLGDLDGALADFQLALTVKPDLTDALTASAGVYSQKGQHQRAIEELTKVIDLGPNVNARFQRGTAYAEMGQHERAIEDFTWVIEQQRDAPFAYYARSKSRRALGDEAGADEDNAIAESFRKEL